MKLKIKRVLAFAMTLTMLLGCFIFSTSAADAAGSPTGAPGAGTGDIKYYGTCTQSGQENQQFFVVRDDGAGNVTMYIYGDKTNKGWFRPLSNTTHWGNTNLGNDGADWCQKNVTKVVIDSGVMALAGSSGDSKGSFYNYTALKYVEVNTNDIDTSDIDTSIFMQRPNIFEGCDLKAIYTTDSSVVDGTADLTYLTAVGRGNNEDGPFNGLSGIETVLLGDKVQFFNPRTFMGMSDLKTVKISATVTSNITGSGKLAASTDNEGVGPMTLPTGAMFECANKEMADRLSEVTYASADIVTYPGKESMAAIDEKESADGKMKYSISEVGDDWVLTVGTTEENTTKEATRLSVAVAEYNTVKSYVTKVVFDDSVSIIGEGVCNGWNAVKEVVLPNGKITMNAKETFMNCSAITSIHPAYTEKADGVANLSTVTEFTGGDGGGWTFQGTGLKTFVFGDTCFNSKFMFGGHGSVDKLVFAGTVYTGRTDIAFNDGEFDVEVWSDDVKLPTLDYYSGTSWVSRAAVTKTVVNSKYVGYQVKTNAANNDIRFVAVIGEADVFDKVGFDIEVTNKPEKDKEGETTKVYSSIAGSNKDGSFTYTAEQLGGKYVFTITITGVPAADAIEFTVKPYVIKTGSSEKTYGASGTVTIGGAN